MRLIDYQLHWNGNLLKKVSSYDLCVLGDLDRECDLELCFFFLCDFDFVDECLSDLLFDLECDLDLDLRCDLFGDLEGDFFLRECDDDL